MGGTASPIIPVAASWPFPTPWPFHNTPEEVGDVTRFISAEGKGEIDITDETGHTKKIWDSKDPDSVESARREYDFLVGEKKFHAFAVDKKGEPGERLKAFDPNLEKIIFIRQQAGG